MASDAAVQWVSEQLPAMEAALEALTLQNSFTGNVEGGRRVGRLLGDLLTMPGLEAEVVASQRFAHHLVFRSRGSGPGLLALVGHLDTVFPPGHFEGFRAEGPWRVGPGVHDMKGGLVVLAWALKAVAATVGLDALPPLKVVVTSDEEVGAPESSRLLARELDGAGACLVFQSGRDEDAVVVERKGVSLLTVRAFGREAHAGNAYFEGHNALWALARFIDAAQRLSDPATGVTVNVGLVQGGTAANTVPAEATAELDLRFPTVASRDEVMGRLKAAASTALVPGTRLELREDAGRLPMERQPGTARLLAAWARAAAASGFGAPEAPRQGGGSAGNIAASMGVPTLDALGPRGRGYHTLDERIDAASLVARAAATARFLLDAGRDFAQPGGSPPGTGA